MKEKKKKTRLGFGKQSKSWRKRFFFFLSFLFFNKLIFWGVFNKKKYNGRSIPDRSLYDYKKHLHNRKNKKNEWMNLWNFAIWARKILFFSSHIFPFIFLKTLRLKKKGEKFALLTKILCFTSGFRNPFFLFSRQ